jgi:hypothetical protein
MNTAMRGTAIKFLSDSGAESSSNKIKGEKYLLR